MDRFVFHKCGGRCVTSALVEASSKSPVLPRVRRDYMPASYRDLRVWRRSMELALSVYAATQAFPKQELYGLVSQMRRATVSVPSNIAEGKGRLTDRDRAHFFAQARGSLLELETQILIAAKLGYLSGAASESLLDLSREVGRMLNSLIESIRPRSERSGTWK